MKLPDHIKRQFFTVEVKDKVKTDGMSVLITIRGEHRIPQLMRCVEWAVNQTLTPLEIIIIEDGPIQTLDTKFFEDLWEVKHLYIKNDGLFCKSACYNYGASNAKYACLCGIDADLLIPSDFLTCGYMQLQKYDACFMADDIFYLKGDMKNMFDFDFSGETWRTHRAKWQFHGGSFFIKTQKYFDIGGHDENFKGHGSEDSEFYKRVHDTLKVYTGSHCMLHVEHGRELSDFSHIDKNKNYLYAVQNIDLSTRINTLKTENQYLKSNKLDTSSTIIPNIIPGNINMEERMKRFREFETNYVQQPGEPVVVKDQIEARRRRVLGF